MPIQWFPGHMHKAQKELKVLLPDVDLVIEVLDARIPDSSANPLLATLSAGKPRLKILNKCDLADPQATLNWQTHLEREQNVKSLALTMQEPHATRPIETACRALMADKLQKGRSVQALVVGIPNVGKSTLINRLAGRPIAKTGNEPAVTQARQRIDLGQGLVLFDTPGLLWPNIENPHSGFRLAATFAIKDTAIDHESIALYLGRYLLQHYATAVGARFQFEVWPNHERVLLETLGRQRGCLRAGGVVDLDKAAKILLNEFRSGQLGRITLETPDMLAEELAEVEQLRHQKELQKQARKNRWKQSREPR